MSGLSRHILLASQSLPFEHTGLDFVSVDPTEHRNLQIHFVISPDQLANPPLSADEFHVRIRSLATGRTIPILSKSFLVLGSPDNRTVLSISCADEGGFEFYSMEVEDRVAARIDPFLNHLQFSFKQSCPSRFDCKDEPDCPLPEQSRLKPDYLARDFESYRRLLLEHSAENYPNWQINNPADEAVMIAELLASIGDEMALVQDQYFFEGQWEQLTQKRSFNALAQLVDYQLRPESGAQGFAIFRHYIGRTPTGGASIAAEVPAGARIWGASESNAFIPFETGKSLKDILDKETYHTRSDWTDWKVYPPFEDCTCLNAGESEIYVYSHISHPELLFPKTPILIETRGDDPFQPPKSIIVYLREFPSHMTDVLAGNLDITILRFEPPLPFSLNIENAFVSANLVPIQSGETIETRFQIGDLHPDLPSSIEREGPLSSDPCQTRPVVHRFPLKDSVAGGLSWQQTGNSISGTLRYEPDVILREELPDGTHIAFWEGAGSNLEFQSTDERFVVEHGTYGSVFQFYENGAYHNFQDYLGDAGYTIRFGSAGFGIEPAEGTIFTAFFRTSFADEANLPAGAVKYLSLDTPNPSSPPQAVIPVEILSVENPFPLTGASRGEAMEVAREIAPRAYQSKRFYAVRDEDYAEMATRLDFVQSATANSRWTGMWNTVFTNLDTFAKNTSEREDFQFKAEAHLNLTRQAGKEVVIRDAETLPLHLNIEICTQTGYNFDNVAKAISDKLSGKNPDAFFHPDEWIFGEALSRAELERKIAGVQGVAKILKIHFAVGFPPNFKLFETEQIQPFPGQILQLQNDANHPELGSIRILNGAKSEVPT